MDCDDHSCSYPKGDWIESARSISHHWTKEERGKEGRRRNREEEGFEGEEIGKKKKKKKKDSSLLFPLSSSSFSSSLSSLPLSLSCELLDAETGEWIPQTLTLLHSCCWYENRRGYFFRHFLPSSPYTSFLQNIPAIPSVIYQTHRSWEYVKQRTALRLAVRSWTDHCFHPRAVFRHVFHSDDQARQFVQEHFDPRVLEAYDKCPLAVMRADLWRYCVLYENGGVYADADTHLLRPHTPSLFQRFPRAWLVAAMEYDSFFCQWTFACPPRSVFLKTIIDLSVDRILAMETIRGEHVVHFLTGPVVFTDGIEKCLEAHGYSICPDESRRVDFYSHYQNEFLHVFPPDQFHGTVVRHLFDGMRGWKQERDRLLK